MWRARTAAWLAVAAAILAACGNFAGPAPVFDRSYGERAVRPDEAAGVHVVQRGETVYGIAQRYGVSTRAVIDSNKLLPPFLLTPGTQLRVPPAQVHVVQRGDTVYAISRRYGVDMASLVALNRLRAPYTIHVGQRLRLPFEAEPPTQVAAVAPVAPKLPDRAVTVSPPRAEVAPPAPELKTEVRAVPSVPSRDSGGFIWPVNGRVLSSFGPKAAGLHNDGLNIAAPLGAPVRAADNGVVAYAGNRIRGFGNLLLIKHDDGLITAYAHADKLLVARGDVVTRGQVVARVGQSGGVATPQLHFEVRRGTQAVDPRKFLPS